MGPDVPRPGVNNVKGLECPNCGGSVELRAGGRAINAVCTHCLSILDASTSPLSILQKAHDQQRYDTLIPLGQRGTLDGIVFEHIGYQVRETSDEEETFRWTEYLLFNPYHGYRYLSEYEGHWNLIRSVRRIPIATTSGGKSAQQLGNKQYRFFQGAAATTAFVLGEFPYQVRVGERVGVQDFVDPPEVLSSESTEHETTWSLGRYLPGGDVWSAFKLPGSAPVAQGVYLNQPNNISSAGMWSVFGIGAICLIALAVFMWAFSGRQAVFDEQFTAQSGVPNQESSFVTRQFTLQGRSAAVKVETNADVENDWIYLNYALINADSGHAFDFGREVEYYNQYGEREGSKTDSVVIPSVPAGNYYLRIEPELDSKPRPDGQARLIRYNVKVIRDVPRYSFFWLGLLLLSIPPVVQAIRAGAFEQRRWQESGGSETVKAAE